MTGLLGRDGGQLGSLPSQRAVVLPFYCRKGRLQELTCMTAQETFIEHRSCCTFAFFWVPVRHLCSAHIRPPSYSSH
jgi:hypothetical protein